jgi:hypothetical protein
MSLLESGEANDQGYQEWTAGMSERIAARRERLGIVATKQETHIPLNPQSLVDNALRANKEAHIEEAANHIKQTDDFLSELTKMLAAS